MSLKDNPELEVIIKEMWLKSYDKGMLDGGLFVLKTLREAMKVSGLKKVEPVWLDSSEKELKKALK